MSNVDFIKVGFTETGVAVKYEIATEYNVDEDGFHIMYCPSLKLGAQGDTEAEVEQGMSDVFVMFFESCIERNVLAERLDRLGFQQNADLPQVNGETVAEVEAKLCSDTITIPLNTAQLNTLKQSRSIPCGYYHN